MFFINNYSFYSTHRKELIEFLSDYKRMFVVCNMKGNKDEFNRVSFIDTNFSDASFSLINILKDTYLSFRVLFKSKEHINFFVSPRIILLGILNSFLFWPYRRPAGALGGQTPRAKHVNLPAFAGH